MKALIAMSGGVDSSAAAVLMRDAGWDCLGVTMKLYQNEEIGLTRAHTCCSLDDVEDARAVAFRLGMPYYVFNFGGQFRQKVMLPFVQSYQQGRTPNPCIDCNRYLKFDALFQRARELRCDAVVTGHYARTRLDAASGRWQLLRGLDASKDQSYVLYTLTQQQLAVVRFPVGALTKAEVRALAQERGLVNAAKPDSQDICFVPNGRYTEFIERFTGAPAPPGDFVDLQGRVVGRHRGLVHYTIGQHKGLGLVSETPLYVCAINAADNTVTVGPGEAAYRRTLTARDLNFIAVEGLPAPRRVQAKIRYRQTEQWATAVQTAPDELRVEFDEPQRAITPGQAVVLYDGDVVLGGGTIQ